MSMYGYMYMYVCMYVCMYIYYIYLCIINIHSDVVKKKFHYEILKLFLDFVRVRILWKRFKNYKEIGWKIKFIKRKNDSRICQNIYISEKFPSELRIAEAVFIFKKNDPNDKTNYQSISLLPVMSEIYGEVKYEKGG